MEAFDLAYGDLGVDYTADDFYLDLLDGGFSETEAFDLAYGDLGADYTADDFYLDLLDAGFSEL